MGQLTSPLARYSLPITTHVLCSFLPPAIKKILEKIYRHLPQNCDNGGPQVNGINFDQYSSPVLADPTLRMVISIASSYHPTIGIMNVDKAVRNTLKASSESKIIY